MSNNLEARVRSLETAIAVLIEHTGLGDAVDAERERRRAVAAEKSKQIGEGMSAATRAASDVNQRHRSR